MSVRLALRVGRRWWCRFGWSDLAGFDEFFQNLHIDVGLFGDERRQPLPYEERQRHCP